MYTTIRCLNVQFLTIAAGLVRHARHPSRRATNSAANRPIIRSFIGTVLNTFKKVLDKPNLRAYAARVERVQFQRRPVMNMEIVTYLVYLTISIALTIWVAHTLHKNVGIFLVFVLRVTQRL